MMDDIAKHIKEIPAVADGSGDTITKSKKSKKKTRIYPNKKPGTKEAERQQFILFIALPRPLRQTEFGYNNDKDFAEKYDVHPATLVEWKKDKNFWIEVTKIWKRWGKDRTPDVIAGLYRRSATEGHGADVLVWMKIIEEFKEKSVVESEDLKTFVEGFKSLLSSGKQNESDRKIQNQDGGGDDIQGQPGETVSSDGRTG
jgi:hypothetical protein